MPIEKEPITEAKNLVMRSTRVFLVVPPSPTPDALASAELISRRLKQAAKEAYASEIGPIRGWEFLPITLGEKQAINPNILVTINTNETPIGELRYEKQDGSLVIILSPKEKPIPVSAIRVSEGIAKTDCIITIGVQSLDILGDLFQKNPRLFFETPIIAIDYSIQNDKHGEINLIDPKAGSISEAAWQFASAISPGSMNKDEATLVLSGILEKTENLMAPAIQPQTFLLASECVNRGAQREEIIARLEKKEKAERLPILQLWGRALVRSRMLERSKTAISLLTAEDFTTTGVPSSEIGHIIDRVGSHLAGADRILMLWQEPGSQEIRAAVKTHHEKELGPLQERLNGELKTGIIFVRERFSSFIAAENALIPRLSA